MQDKYVYLGRQINRYEHISTGFPRYSSGKKLACQMQKDTRDMGLIPWLGRSPREGNGNPLQYSWKIPWMRSLGGGLQSVGLQRVRHD